jgi:hypothetical protein
MEQFHTFEKFCLWLIGILIVLLIAGLLMFTALQGYGHASPCTELTDAVRTEPGALERATLAQMIPFVCVSSHEHRNP